MNQAHSQLPIAALPDLPRAELPLSPETIRLRYLELRGQRPPMRARDIAARLGLREAQLIAALCGDEAVRLDTGIGAQLGRLSSLGPVMALTRNEAAVIEKDGAYGRFEDFGHASQFVGEDIDLRLFLRCFRSAFAVTEAGRHGPVRSLQYFDAHGDAVHKIYLREASDLAAYDALIARHRSPSQDRSLSVDPPPAPEARRPRELIDGAGFTSAFRAMKDTHEFFGLLRRFELPRLQALELLPEELAQPAAPGALRRVLLGAAATGLPIMVFVSSRGVVQIHSGPVENIKQVGAWLNVMDRGFNLHVDEGLLAGAWRVRKPTADGPVSSLEVYDTAGQLALSLFGRRKPGHAESSDWRRLLDEATAPR
jgi:putative hemin transport protein